MKLSHLLLVAATVIGGPSESKDEDYLDDRAPWDFFKKCKEEKLYPLPSGVESIKCHRDQCKGQCKEGTRPVGRRRVRCIKSKKTGFYTWRKHFSKCAACDPDVPEFDDSSIIQTCKMNKKTGLRECKLKCSGQGSIGGRDKAKIACRCPKNGGKGKRCNWWMDGQKLKTKEVKELKCESPNAGPASGQSVDEGIDEYWENASSFPNILEKKPHILFILADDYGFSDIGYHNKEVKTPIMDSLAATGIKLENYYVQPGCTPTRAQLMTGRYQIRTGLQKGVFKPLQPRGVPLDEKLMPEALKQCGYDTEMFGKWHLGFYQKEYQPHYRGFDHYLGFLTGGSDFYTHEKCFVQKGAQHEHFRKTKLMCGYDFREARAGENENIRFDLNGTYVNDALVEGIRKKLSTSDPEKPVFTYLAMQGVHTPIQAPKKFNDMYSHIGDEVRRNYLGCASTMDDSIGQVIDLYKKYGYWENTIVIFSSDNGGRNSVGGYNFPLRGEKGGLYEGGIRSIGFVNSPLLPESRRGTVSENLIHVTDWLPTFMHFGQCQGMKYGGKPLDGVSQAETLWTKKEKYEIRNEILQYINPYSIAKESDPRGDWKDGVLKDKCFTVETRATIRWNQWKLHTGLSAKKGEKDKWNAPPRSWTTSNNRKMSDITCRADECDENDIDNFEMRSAPSCFFQSLSRKNKTAFIPKNLSVNPIIHRQSSRLVKLYDIEKDPTERKDVSDDHPDIVDKLLVKIAGYYDHQKLPWNPGNDFNGDPKFHDGVWKAWQ